jgi:methylthioribose-1-phosphate isomerase
MKLDGVHHRTIWLNEDDGWSVGIIDQTRLPHEWAIARLTTPEEAARAIRDMQVRGAPLIGATAAYGLCLALRADPSTASLDRAYELLLGARPTAVNLRWALDDMRGRPRSAMRTSRPAAGSASTACRLSARLTSERAVAASRSTC